MLLKKNKKQIVNKKKKKKKMRLPFIKVIIQFNSNCKKTQWSYGTEKL